MGLFQKIFGTYSERELKSIYPIADQIEALADEYKALSDAELQAKTPAFKERLANGETLDDILPEAFATVREAADRVLGLRPYRVQLIGGIVLHQGRIAEMKTGEGKTLVATLPAYLNALSGEGVHIVTVNDYLAKRDSEWMGKVHRFLGLTVGLIVHDMDKAARQASWSVRRGAGALLPRTGAWPAGSAGPSAWGSFSKPLSYTMAHSSALTVLVRAKRSRLRDSKSTFPAPSRTDNPTSTP